MSIPFKKYGYKLNPITHEFDNPQIFLVNKQLKKIGELYPTENLEITINEANQPDEISFTYYKEANGKSCFCFDKLVDLSVIQVGDYGFFECEISKNENASISKNVVGRSLGHCELSQILATLEINTDDDMSRTDYDRNYPTVFYRDISISDNKDIQKKKKDSSLLNRILSYAPHYKIGYVSPTLKNVQRTFSWNDTDLVSVLNDIATEISCIFDIQVTLNEDGEAERCINAYDIQYCDACWNNLGDEEKMTSDTHEFRNIVNGVCQNCGKSESVKDIGHDTNIFISTDNLSDEITIVGDKDSIKNCFKVIGGDDLMTAAVQGLNMSANNRIMMFSEEQRKLMTKALINKLDEYEADYAKNLPAYEKLLETQYNIYDMVQYLQSGKMPILEEEITSTLEALLAVVKKITIYYNNCFYISSWNNYDYTSAKTSIKNLFTTFMPKGFSFHLDTNNLLYTTEKDYNPQKKYHWYGSIQIYSTDNKEDYVTLYVSQNSGTYIRRGKTGETVSYTDPDNIIGNFSVTFNFADQDQTDYLSYLKQHTAYLLKEADLEYENEKARNWDQYSYNRLKSYYDGFQTCIETLDEMSNEIDTSTTASADIITQIRDNYVRIQSHIQSQMSILLDQIFALNTYQGEYSHEFTDTNGNVWYQLKNFNNISEVLAHMIDTKYRGGYQIGSDGTIDVNNFKPNQFIGTKPCKCRKCNSINVSVTTEGSNICNNCGSKEVYSYLDIMKDIVQSYEENKVANPNNSIADMRKGLQNNFDIQKYFNNDALYHELLTFMREDVYTNDNYTSDGLTNSQLIRQAKELTVKAKQELSKSCVPQYTITAPISAIVGQTAFEYQGAMVEDIYSKFVLNNYVRVRIDGEIYKMRIASISYSFPITDKIEVTFSNVSRYTNGVMSDVASILQSAASMATSYSYVATQAEKGQQANNTFDTIKNEGLNAGLMTVKGGRDQDVVIDNHGILLRKKIEEIDDYSPYQMKLINRNIVLTDNNWKDAKMAIGYGLYNNNPVYGIWADLLVGDLTITKELQVINDKGTVIIDENGITLDGGAITWKKKLSSSSIDGLDDTLQTFVSKTIYDQGISDLQSQIDGNITTWFYEYEPTANNKPAVDWNTDNKKIAHEGDLFYCTNENSAHAYRYVYNDTTNQHEWLLIKDTDVTKALANAAKAQDTADNKRRVFVAQPQPPYDVGDLWVQGEYGDILKCRSSRQSGTYESSDWESASKYTGDDRAEEIADDLDVYKTEINKFKNKIDGSLNATEIGEDYVISPKIGGGYLCIASGDYSVEIDPSHKAKDNKTKDGYLFCIRNKIAYKNDDVIMGVNTDGNGYFKGQIIATSGKIGNWNIRTNGWLTADGSAGISWDSSDGKTHFSVNGDNLEMGRIEENNPKIRMNAFEDTTNNPNGNCFTTDVGYISLKSKGNIILESNENIKLEANGYIEISGSQNEYFNIWRTTKFYKGLRLYGTNTDYAELGVSCLDNTASGAYLLAKSSMAVSHQLQVGTGLSDQVWTGLDDYKLYVRGSSYVTGTSYTNSGTTVTSDKNKKNSITTPSDHYVELFDALNFRKFKYNDGTSDRYHLGVIAQEVEEAMNETGISSQDFGGLVIDEQGNYFVRYDEINVLTALKVKELEKTIQMLHIEKEEQAKEISALKDEMDKLNEALAELKR